MILLDTSVWIEVFRKKSPLRLEGKLDLDEVVPVLESPLGQPVEVVHRDRDFANLAGLTSLRQSC